MASPGDALLPWSTKQFGMQVGSSFLLRLQLLDRNAVGIGPGILPDPGHLPGDFHARFSAGDLEAIGLHSLGDVNRGKAIKARKLVAEVTVQLLKPLGKRNDRLTTPVKSYVAVVDVHHVGRFDEGVVEVLIGRVERVVDLERSSSLGQIAVHVDVAQKKRRETAALILGKQSISRRGVIGAY